MATSLPLTFEPITEYEPGILARMLRESYAEVLAESPQYWSAEPAKWDAFDREVFANLGTIGRCVFVTCLAGEPIGFGSYDPRGVPEVGIVGHHCILPAYRGHGFGRRQLEEIAKRLSASGARRIVATTGEQPFFEPARHAYLACGFLEYGRSPGGPDPRYGTLGYRRTLAEA